MKRLALVVLALALSPLAGAQVCTSTQFPSGGACYSLQTLKTAIQADGSLNSQPNSPDGNAAIAAAFNATASPACFAFVSKLTADAQRTAILGPGASQLDNLSQVKQSSLFYAAQGTIDLRSSDIRAALDNFAGTQNTLKAALQATWTRSNTTRAEALYKSSGSCTACATWGNAGACSSGSPAVTTFEGQITGDIVERARLLP